MYSIIIYTLPLCRGVCLNEHLELMTTLCQPCVFDYYYYANFKYLPEDANRVMDKFGIPHFYYRDVESHPLYTTDELTDFFYGDMTSEERAMELRKIETKELRGKFQGYQMKGLAECEHMVCVHTQFRLGSASPS